MKNQGRWCLLQGISFLISLGFTFVVGDQYLQSFEFNKVTTSVAIKCGKPQSLSLHKIVAQQPSISGQTRADVVKTITTEFFYVEITYYCFCSDKLNLPLPELVALYLLVCFLKILSCTVQKSLSPHLKPQMVYF